MIQTIDGYTFNFPNALALFKFDEQDQAEPRFHGAPMKAVDVIAEFADKYLFIEIKDFHDKERYNAIVGGLSNEDKLARKDSLKYLKNSLKYKLRDTYLYRSLENKTDKPIHYICLLNFDDALNLHLKQTLSHDLPIGIPKRIPTGRWQREIAHSFNVLNMAKWNNVFPTSPLTIATS